MAVTGRAASFPLLKISNPSPSPPLFSLGFSPASVVRSPALEMRAGQEKETMVLYSSRDFGSLRGGGAGLLERPNLDQSQFDPLPQVQEGGDIGRLSYNRGIGSGDSYRVLLIDDERHTEQLVIKALPQVVPSITVGDARKLFHESRQIGVAVVITTVKEHAEFYAQMMFRRGLRSAIEPDSNMA